MEKYNQKWLAIGPTTQKEELNKNLLLENKGSMKKNKIITSKQFNSKYRKTSKGIVRSTEESEQASLLEWFKLSYPDAFYTVDMGGVNLSPSQRSIHNTRCKKGHPDLMFQEWYKDLFCGLAIEFKRTGEVLNPSKFKGQTEKAIHLRDQLDYLLGLRSRSWIAGFVVGRVNAEKVIKHYFEAGPNSLEIINKLIYPKMKFKK